MNPWAVLAAPFILGGIAIGAIKAFEAYERYSYNRDRRVRDQRLNRYSMGALKPVTKDWWLS
jgi:hypothetical protein